MEEHGCPIRRVINGGGIPQRNETLNQVYANVLNKPVLVPESDVTSLGSAIFAFLAAGTFKTIEEAQAALVPDASSDRAGSQMPPGLRGAVPLYRKLYFAFGLQTLGASGRGRRAALPAADRGAGSAEARAS